MSITLLILFNAASIIHLAAIDYKDYDEDISIGIKQLSVYLMSGSHISHNSYLEYDYSDGKHYTVSLNHHRLVKQPGFEILITDIDDVSFKEKKSYLYITITRDEKSYEFLLSDLYRIEQEEEDSDESEEETS